MCDVSDAQDDVQSDMVWATYGEIAEAKSISKRAVARMTQRHRLRRQPGNDGKVRVLISRDMLAPSHRASQRADESDEQSGTLQAVGTAYDTALAAKDQESAARDAVVAELRTRLDQARAELSEARMEISALTIAAEQAEAAARTAEERVAKMEAAEAARRGRGRWSRLRAAWRGE
jgi:hypothetical protein